MVRLSPVCVGNAIHAYVSVPNPVTQHTYNSPIVYATNSGTAWINGDIPAVCVSAKAQTTTGVGSHGTCASTCLSTDDEVACPAGTWKVGEFTTSKACGSNKQELCVDSRHTNTSEQCLVWPAGIGVVGASSSKWHDVSRPESATVDCTYDLSTLTKTKFNNGKSGVRNWIESYGGGGGLPPKRTSPNYPGYTSMMRQYCMQGLADTDCLGGDPKSVCARVHATPAQDGDLCAAWYAQEDEEIRTPAAQNYCKSNLHATGCKCINAMRLNPQLKPLWEHSQQAKIGCFVLDCKASDESQFIPASTQPNKGASCPCVCQSIIWAVDNKVITGNTINQVTDCSNGCPGSGGGGGDRKSTRLNSSHTRS